jgi:hypothetical protein
MSPYEANAAPEPVESDTDEDILDEDYDPLGLDENDDDTPPIGSAGMNAGEIALYLLDWMASNKITDTAGMDMWKLLQCVLPEGTSMRTFWSVKNRMKDHELSSVVRIDICPNDCVAYFDSVHLTGV